MSIVIEPRPGHPHVARIISDGQIVATLRADRSDRGNVRLEIGPLTGPENDLVIAIGARR